MRGLLLSFGLLVLLAMPTQAAEYESGFGFGISVPEVWLVLTQSEVAKNASLFTQRSEERFGSIPAAMREAVFARVEAGELEIFYRREGSVGSFVDNVNVLIQGTDLPAPGKQLQEVCHMLPGEFSHVFGRPIAMDRCEMRKIARRPALYLQFDGAIPGTTALQYQIQRRRGETLVVTATASNENLTRMLSEFEAMVESIRLH